MGLTTTWLARGANGPRQYETDELEGLIMTRRDERTRGASHHVYVSSTYDDLVPYRRSVTGVIRRLGAVDISMEDFGARDQRPIELCLKLLQEQTDVYVGIFAYRYGYVPEGTDISITEAEYRTATSLQIPRFIYIVDRKVPWIPAYIDKGRKEAKLQRLLKHLQTHHSCGFFSSPDDLSAQVAADLGRLFTSVTLGSR